MAFTRTTEVRHISTVELTKIAEILDQPSTSPAWKKLMLNIPYDLRLIECLSYCILKYTCDDIKLIESEGAKEKNMPFALIFLHEWITSGKNRPTLGHLLQLLKKCELFRAADYVAVNLLGEAEPQRPSEGPAARIDITLTNAED